MRSHWIATITLCLLGTAATPAAADPNMTGVRELRMMQCPSAAPGATTTAHKIRRGVELQIGAATDWQRREIRRRAAVQQETASRRGRGSIEHTGQGTGSGRFGYCPGMLAATTIVVDNTADGVRLTITAKSDDVVAELQRGTLERVARLRREAISAKR